MIDPEDVLIDLDTKQRACLEYCPHKGNCRYYQYERDNCPKIKELKVAFLGVIRDLIRGV